MKLRSRQKAVARRDARRANFDALMSEHPYKNYPRGAVTRPGSQNPRKGGAPVRKKTRRS